MLQLQYRTSIVADVLMIVCSLQRDNKENKVWASDTNRAQGPNHAPVKNSYTTSILANVREASGGAVQAAARTCALAGVSL